MPEDGKILVTGAGGFIGGRIVEVLHAANPGTVRAGVRRWASAARIGRFPVEIVQCDVTDASQVRKSLQGVDAVVHCAVGPHEVTVGGTRTLLEAAHESQVRRFVHISTIDVYGGVSGDVDETHSLQYTKNPYGDSKIDAEKACLAAVERGVPVAILRPSLVYGPFSESWTIEWAQRLQALPWMLAERDCQGVCNLVYVDDLVGAVLRALDRPEAVGQAFNVNGPERPTWQEYFEALNGALALPPLRSQTPSTSHLSTQVMRPVRAGARLLLDHFDDQVMQLYQRFELAKRVMKWGEGLIRKTPTIAEFSLLARTATYPTEKARTQLGWSPRFRMADGVELSAAWLRHHGYVTGHRIHSPPQAR
jgi:nucleoside-diphosphate-sugar epimerase